MNQTACMRNDRRRWSEERIKSEYIRVWATVIDGDGHQINLMNMMLCVCARAYVCVNILLEWIVFIFNTYFFGYLRYEICSKFKWFLRNFRYFPWTRIKIVFQNTSSSRMYQFKVNKTQKRTLCHPSFLSEILLLKNGL